MVLIPPAVDPGDPPIIIKIIVKNLPALVIPDVDILLNPAVLGVTAAKKEFKTFSPPFIVAMVSGLLYSNRSIKIVPPITKNPVTSKTIFVCTENLLILFTLYSSVHTPKPNPPIIIRAAAVSITKALVLWVVKLTPPPNTSKPALQNAEIEWNIL